MTTDAALADLLDSRGAEGIAHPGGTLGAHLGRVQQRLARLGAPEPVQLAGRAHAVYGTDGFDVPLLELEERPVLAAVIGEGAERLVYRYGACDRGRTWRTLADTGRVHDRFTGAEELLDGGALRQFADLTVVNELDVAEHSPDFLPRHGDWLRGLVSSWSALLSPSVAADAAEVLSRSGAGPAAAG